MFDRDSEVVVAKALTGTWASFEWILTVGPLPPDNEKAAILYLPSDEVAGST
jgi:hypothetical protein